MNQVKYMLQYNFWFRIGAETRDILKWEKTSFDDDTYFIEIYRCLWWLVIIWVRLLSTNKCQYVSWVSCIFFVSSFFRHQYEIVICKKRKSRSGEEREKEKRKRNEEIFVLLAFRAEQNCLEVLRVIVPKERKGKEEDETSSYFSRSICFLFFFFPSLLLRLYYFPSIEHLVVCRTAQSQNGVKSCQTNSRTLFLLIFFFF